MEEQRSLLTSETIHMLIASVTNSGEKNISELEAERLLNAITRAQSNTPTGPKSEGQNVPLQ